MGHREPLTIMTLQRLCKLWLYQGERISGFVTGSWLCHHSGAMYAYKIGAGFSSWTNLSFELSTVFPLISARGAYKIEKWHCLFYLLISAPCGKSNKEWNTEKQNKTNLGFRVGKNIDVWFQQKNPIIKLEKKKYNYKLNIWQFLTRWKA